VSQTDPEPEDEKPDVEPTPEPKEEPTGHGPEESVDPKPELQQ
jgi:hypothetical protein